MSKDPGELVVAGGPTEGLVVVETPGSPPILFVVVQVLRKVDVVLEDVYPEWLAHVPMSP